MAIKLILSDIDDTILPSGDTRISDRSIQAFHAAMDAGIRAGVASGRGYVWIPPFFGGDSRCVETCVATNGNEVYLDGCCIRKAQLDAHALRALYDFLSQIEGAGIIAFDDKDPVLVLGSKEDLSYCFPAYAAICRTDAQGKALGLPRFSATKANVFLARNGAAADEASTRTLIDQLNHEIDGFDFDFPRLGYINVMKAGWNKASGIELIAQKLGIGFDEIVVFGDAGNDLSMFNLVENSVAVANATEEAVKAARWHIGACKDEAVAQAIEQLAQGEWPFSH